jgi:hypothetical protein
MGKHYSAFGLSLRSSFSLPGLAPSEDDSLPWVKLELETAAGLSAAWSGSAAQEPWRGSLKDGSPLTLAWGREGDLLFGYGDRARFRLDPSAARLECAPAGVAAMAWQRVLLSRVLPVVAVVHGYEALHAAAVETPAGVVAVAAPSGMGKSTLTRELMRRGNRFFADDVLVIGSGDAGVRAFPATPHMSVLGEDAAATRAVVPGRSLGMLGGKLWIAVEHAPRSPREVAAVVLLERARDLPLEARELPASPLSLAPFMVGALEEKGRDADRFSVYSDLVEGTRLVRLSGGEANRPAELADALEATLASPPSLVGQDAAA